MSLTDPFQPPVIPDAEPETPSLEPDENAPYGYTIDRATGQRRPKKRAGRTGLPKTDVEDDIVEVKPEQRVADKVPGKVKPAEPKGRSRKVKPEPEPLPPFRAGPIAKGVNRLYLKAGKIVRAMDYDIGTAIIAITKKESEDDITVGEAWEEIAKVNPRIRRVLMRLITGGAWGQLFMAHAPVLLAILLKDRIRDKIPMMGLVSSFLDDSDDADGFEDYGTEPSGMGGLLAGITPQDMAQAMSAFSSFMPQMAPRVPEQGRAAQVDDFGAGED